MISTPSLTYDEVARLKPVRIWLWVLALMVFCMVLVGGATRLTDSGLSITEWKPIHGIIPPLNEAQWQEELEKYRQIPEYQLINKGMSMSEFQFIYWWEWGHRFLGRMIGFAFLIPFGVFVAQKRIPRWLMPRLAVLFVLGGLQGAIGWWMVASGLVERTDVSQYRLATHLTMAAVIFMSIIWVAESLRSRPVKYTPDSDRVMLAHWPFLILLQIFLGGLVAGLDAGMGYTTWPLMDGAIIPSGLLIQEPWWRNFFENALTVQFVHRCFAYALLIFAGFMAWRFARHGEKNVYGSSALLLLGLLLTQALIGILTLFYQVPLDLALMHQGGAFVILAYVTIWLRRATASV